MSYFKKLSQLIAEKSQLCVGLDTALKKIPVWLKAAVLDGYNYTIQADGKVDGEDPDEVIIQVKALPEVMSRFNEIAIHKTQSYAACYKLNFAFYLRYALHGGMEILADSISRIHDISSLAILDFKESDIGNTTELYAAAAFDEFKADAVTVNPFLGFEDALGPFLERTDKGIYVLCHTSNKSAAVTQDVMVFNSDEKIDNDPYYLHIAKLAVQNNKHGNVGLVMGATYPRQISEVRDEVGADMHLLLPAIGAQGGPFEESLTNAGKSAVFNVSRDIIFNSSGSDFAEAMEKKAQYYAEAANKINGGGNE